MSADMEEKLAAYRQQLAQVEAAIAQDPDNAEWVKLRQDLLEVIDLTSELAQVKASSAAAASSTETREARTYVVGEKCQAMYEMDGQWYNAKVVALAEDGYFVSFLGYGNTAQVNFSEVRPYKRPDTSAWVRGAEVSAVFAADSRWYDATVVGVKDSVVQVVFNGESEPVEVDIDFVRTKQSTAPERTRKPYVLTPLEIRVVKALCTSSFALAEWYHPSARFCAFAGRKKKSPRTGQR
eukprot:6179057-Pleurochrysis_carterae.AAC.1